MKPQNGSYADFSIVEEQVEFLDSEKELPDDYPCYSDYYYICDKILVYCWMFGLTLGELKRRNQITSFRNAHSSRFL